MSVTPLYGTTATGAPQQAPQQKTADRYPTAVADIVSARVTARLSGKRVEALSERSETSTTWVNKDGSLTTEVAAGAIRFKDAASGEWRDIDVDFAAAPDGSVASKAHPQGLRLSGKAGTKAASLRNAQSAAPTDLVSVGSGDEAITLQWRGGLPTPTLNGPRATYTDVVPGADVVVEATRTGFEQFVEVKARPEAGFSYTLPLRAKGLKVEQQPDGGVLFTDKKSKKTAMMPVPVMWDASVDPLSGEHSRRVKAAMKVVKTKDGADLVITPDAAFLADTATKYPVTVDPSTASLSSVFDTYVQQGETVDWSADTELDLGNPGTQNADSTYRVARSFITWNTAPISDALVSDAKVSLWNFHSGNTDCVAYPWEVWDAGKASTSSRWTAQPAWNTKYATSTETKGNPACTAAPDGWINADVTTLAQAWASAKNATSGMGLRAASETAIPQWKRVNSANAAANPPKLVVTYNYRPRTGTDQQAGPPFFKDTTGTWFVNTTTPTLRDTFADPNNDKVDGTYQIFDDVTGTQVGNVLVSPFVPSGQPTSVTVPAGVLTNGKTYKFRTSPYDGTNYNTGWSAYAKFTVDTTAPSAPATITSTDYPAGQWVKGAGQVGRFTVTPAAGDQNGLEWSLDGATWTKATTGGTTTPVALDVTPAKAGTNVLQVRSTDRAENKSEALSYTFQVGAGGVTTPNDGTRTAARVPLAGEADATKYDKVSFAWRRSDADAWTTIPATDVTNAGAPLTWPLALAAGKSPTLTWNATSTVTPDGTVQVRADFTGPGAAAVSSEPVRVVVDRKADGAATENVGPGSLNLLTGDLKVPATDVSLFGMSVGRTHSSRDPRGAADQEGQAAIFGPNWVSSVASSLSASEYTGIRRTSNTSLSVSTADGSSIAFTSNAAGTGWAPEPGSEDLTLSGAFGSGDFTLSGTEGTVTTFSKVDPAATTWTVASTLLGGLANTTTSILSEKVVAGGRTLARPRLIVAPTSAATAAACAADVSTKGCRVLQFVYATATTATGVNTGAEFGDFTGQVSAVKLWSTAPGAATATATNVATYRYDSAGRLRQTWDPRLGQSSQSQYTYYTQGADDGLLSAVQLGGTLPISLAYGNVAANPAAGPGMLTKVWHSTLAPGTAGTVNGTATDTVVYGVPLSGAKAPEDLSANAAGAWGQSDLPTDATAVFPADQVPASNKGTDLATGAYGRAVVNYLNASGRLVNQSAPGHRVTTTEYDNYGHQVRTLTAANRELALGVTDAAQAQLADLGINILPSAERARLLSSSSVYSADGQQETDVLDPLHRVTLAADAVSGTTVLAKAGTQLPVRQRTVRKYDEGRPTDGTAKIKNQITLTTTGAQPRAWPELLVDTRQDRTTFNWTVGVPTAQIKDSGGLALTTTTKYDTQGRVVSTLLPASNGSDAGATWTSYYTASGTGVCANRPEWADLVCQSGPAADVTGGGANPVQLPTKTTQYGRFGQVTLTTETANGVTRTTGTTTDASGRPVTVTVSGGVGTAAPATTTAYHPGTGAVTQQTSSTGGTVTKTYDDLGRLLTYTDADGATTTTEYDALNRPTKTTDSAPSTTTYTYDTAIDPRGLATSVTDSVAGTFTARYDADGKPLTQGLPGGYTLTDRQDPTGATTARTYTRDSDGTVLVSDGISETVHGQRATHTGTPGITAAQTYTYDKTGRLVQVQDTSADAVCTTRTYTLDNNTNRTALATATAARGQVCTTTGATTQTSNYDSGDRLVNAGYTYDAFGRTTALPGSSVAYYNTDLVQQQTTGTNRQSWTLDSAQRLRAWTTETNTSGTWTQNGAKTNHYGSDADNPRWITEDTAGTITRNVTGPAGTLAATTTKTGSAVLQFANLRGDITLRLPLDTAVAPTVLDYDEYGQPRPGQATTRYAWIGDKQRSDETPGALALMGVRLYNPATGRFLSTDPIPGASANAYDYCNADPVNCTDLNGRMPGWLKAAIKTAVARAVQLIVTAAVAAWIPFLAPWSLHIGNCAGGACAGVLFGSGGWQQRIVWAVAGCLAGFVFDRGVSTKIINKVVSVVKRYM
ncbi:DNRLRE domain-containing protein [Streptomyces sp. NPDC003952]